MEVAYRYEFDGKGDISYGGATETSNLKGGTLEVNAGLNMQLTKDLYWYALGSYENGRKERGWGVYAGIRYKFGKDYTAESKPEEPDVALDYFKHIYILENLDLQNSAIRKAPIAYWTFLDYR